MAGTMAASSAAVLSSLSQQIEQQSSSRAVVEDRHQNGAQAAVASDPAASHADRLAVKLGVFGLDICQAFNLRWYNDAVPEETGARIPVQGAAGPDTAALLVGNTKQMWEHFLTACSCHQELMDMKDPLDTYIERSIEAVLQDVLPGVAYRCFLGHQQLPGSSSSSSSSGGGSYVAMQRCAQAIGLAHLDTASHLCLHPKYGPWFSLRAVLVFDGVAFQGTQPAELPNPLDATTQRYIRLAVASAMRRSSSDLAGALDAEGRGISTSPPNDGLGSPNCRGRIPVVADVRSQWKKWVAIRDAPCAGHPWRYSKHQLAYHYTGDRDILRRLVAFSSSPKDAPERLAVELELPLAAARRRLRERSRSSSGELALPVCAGGDGRLSARWAAYAAQNGNHGSNGFGCNGAGSNGAGNSGAPGGGLLAPLAHGSGSDGGLRVGSFSSSRRRPAPSLRGVSEDGEIGGSFNEDEPRRPRLGRDSMGSSDGNGGLAT